MAGMNRAHRNWLGATAVVAAAVMLAGGCAMTSTREETAAALDRVLASGTRSDANRARDVYRHPRETLLFFGIRPELHVAEIWPEPGWYTEIIAPLVKDAGAYLAVTQAPNPKSKYVTEMENRFDTFLTRHAAEFGSIGRSSLDSAGADIAPAASLDLILTFRNLHNWCKDGSAPKVLTALFRALKPGGVLGVVDHRAASAAPVDRTAKNGYVNEDYAISLIESAGFRLVAKSEINSNPNDTKDYEQGVWTLPPAYRLGNKDRAKYQAIGESDRFTLKFVKPG